MVRIYVVLIKNSALSLHCSYLVQNMLQKTASFLHTHAENNSSASVKLQDRSST